MSFPCCYEFLLASPSVANSRSSQTVTQTPCGSLGVSKKSHFQPNRHLGRPRIIGATKNDARQVPIPQEPVAIIKEHIGTRTTGLVAPSERNTMMSVNNLTKTWISVRTNPKWRVYDLRAACASLRVNSG